MTQYCMNMDFKAIINTIYFNHTVLSKIIYTTKCESAHMHIYEDQWYNSSMILIR